MTITIEYVAPLDKVEFDRIFDADNITHGDYERLLSKISERFSYVFTTYRKIIGLPLDHTTEWYDFDNESGGHDPVPGYFNPRLYDVEIGVTGNFKEHEFFDWYSESIPTSWLYTAFESELEAEYEENKKQYYIKREADKVNKTKKKSQLQASIKAKLSKEELACIKFI